MDDARLHLLLHKGVALQKLPMTSHTLENKLRRSMYQSSIWIIDLASDQSNSVIKNITSFNYYYLNLTIPYLKNLQSPVAENWGYKKDGDILTLDWGSRLDLVAAKKWDTFRK